VELALLLPVVAILLAAVLQVAVLARDAVQVTHAAREGARAAAVDADPGAARRAVLDASGLDPERLEVRVTGRGEPGSRVRVEVTYRLEAWLPLLGRVLTDRTFAAHATMRVE
jgi:Flp pilus assembly protein TadG